MFIIGLYHKVLIPLPHKIQICTYGRIIKSIVLKYSKRFGQFRIKRVSFSGQAETPFFGCAVVRVLRSIVLGNFSSKAHRFARRRCHMYLVNSW